MSRVAALARAGFLTDASYRVGMLVSLGGLVAATVPVYLIARAMQPLMADSIAGQGGDYFGFVLLGMMATYFVATACSALPGAVASGVRSGTLEALLATPAPLPALLAGLAAYPLLWTLLRATVLLAAGAALGARFAWPGVAAGLVVLALVVLAYLPFGLMGAALLLAFRTTGPLLQGVLAASILLGGVYYPVEVVPGWLRPAAEAVPLGYGLRALRMALLEGAPPAALARDAGVLALMAAGWMAAGSAALAAALRHARRAGTLGQY
jgi:ABC-2 type transport system permease protein